MKLTVRLTNGQIIKNVNVKKFEHEIGDLINIVRVERHSIRGEKINHKFWESENDEISNQTRGAGGNDYFIETSFRSGKIIEII